jgi:ribosomal protein S18 acetylase RimI-like enzyme
VLEIRPATKKDHEAIWQMLQKIAAGGDTYTFDPAITREDALAYWLAEKTHAWVAQCEGELVGTYLLRANQPGGGSHVANAAFVVAPDAQGKGIGRVMAEHCLSEARQLGFRAMQFNFVVSTNASAIHLWKSLGFEIVGTLPGAFRHPQEGYVDAYVMYRSLL